MKRKYVDTHSSGRVTTISRFQNKLNARKRDNSINAWNELRDKCIGFTHWIRHGTTFASLYCAQNVCAVLYAIFWKAERSDETNANHHVCIQHTHTHTNCVTSRWIRFAFVNILPHETNNSNRNNNSLALLGVEASFILGKSGWLERMTIIIMFVWTWTSAYASCTLSVKRNSIWKAAKAKQRASMNYFLRMKILK